MNVVCKVCSDFSPIRCLWNDLVADSASFKLHKSDTILNDNSLRTEIPEIEEEKIDESDEDVLGGLGLDPNHDKISPWKWNCLTPLKKVNK